MTPERMAEWKELTNAYKVPSEFDAYRHTIEAMKDKESAFCLGMFTVLDLIVPER